MEENCVHVSNEMNLLEVHLINQNKAIVFYMRERSYKLNTVVIARETKHVWIYSYNFY